MSTNTKRAECPVSRFDFVNGVGGSSLSSADPHPTNHALAQQVVVGLNGSVMVASRELTTETLGKPEVFSSADLVEQGNTRPLIPLGVDPPDHGRYRRLLDPLFSPRRMEAQEADIAERANHFIDAFIDRGSCNFTTEFAELFPSAVFLGLMGLPWEELETLVRLRDGLLHPGRGNPPPRSAPRFNATPRNRFTPISIGFWTTARPTRAVTCCRRSSDMATMMRRCPRIRCPVMRRSAPVSCC